LRQYMSKSELTPASARARHSLLQRKLAGAKRIEVVLKPPVAKALATLRTRTGCTYSSIIEEALLAAAKR
jgi:hypothetical protein